MNLKRYLLFAGDEYYPLGGWSDFKGSFDTLDDVKTCIINLNRIDWFQIVDTETLLEVFI